MTTELEMERRMTTVENWQAGHEKLCADRFAVLRQDIRLVLSGVAAIVFAVMGWMAVQLYNGAHPTPAPVQAVAGLRG